MANEEQNQLLNEQYSRMNDARTRMLNILPEVVDYVAGLSGFKNKYPEAAAAYAAAKAEQTASESEMDVLQEDDWFNRLGEEVVAGDEVTHLGVTYQVIQPHTLSACWVPGQVPALYKVKPAPGEEWPEFVQPTGAHDAYNKGDKVTYKGEHYISLIDANVWAPDTYPAGWEKQ
jgi:hypothetical protein